MNAKPIVLLGAALPFMASAYGHDPGISPLSVEVPEARAHELQPEHVPFSDEQRVYVAALVEAATAVVAQERTVDTLDPFFGKGQFFFPKDPKKPMYTLLSFRSENFAFRSINVGFHRQHARAPWDSAWISITPRRFPTAVFDMSLPASFFSGLAFQFAHAETNEYGAMRDTHVFCYRLNRGQSPVNLRFTVRPDLRTGDDRYPGGFHHLRIARSPCGNENR